MIPRTFKTDESFLEKLAIGAVGTQKVIENLKSQGHTPVELERGSTGYKIWKTIKIKRVRVPDILCLNSDYLEHRLEAVIILGELHSERSAQLLIKVLMDDSQKEEIRSGAAWALGELNLRSTIPSLISTFGEMSLPIRIEAARSLRKMCRSHADTILDFFRDADENERPGISWALGISGQWDLNELIDRIQPGNEDMRQWGAYIIGSSKQDNIINEIEALKRSDPQLYFAVTVLWKISSSWIYQLKEY